MAARLRLRETRIPSVRHRSTGARPVDLQLPPVRDTLLPSSSLSLIAGPLPSSPPFFLARMGQYGPVRSSAQMVTCPAVGWSLHGAQARTAEGRDRGRRDQPTLRHARPARPRSG